MGNGQCRARVYLYAKVAVLTMNTILTYEGDGVVAVARYLTSRKVPSDLDGGRIRSFLCTLSMVLY